MNGQTSWREVVLMMNWNAEAPAQRRDLSEDYPGAQQSPPTLPCSFEEKLQQGPHLCNYRGAAGLGQSRSPQRPGREFCVRRHRWQFWKRFWKWSEPLNLADPISAVGNPGEDAGVDGMPAGWAPTASPTRTHVLFW